MVTRSRWGWLNNANTVLPNSNKGFFHFPLNQDKSIAIEVAKFQPSRYNWPINCPQISIERRELNGNCTKKVTLQGGRATFSCRPQIS